MPTDANGVHTLPDGYLAVTGATVLASQHNPPLEDLSASMTLRFMRSGVAPMTGGIKAVDGSVSAPGYTFSTSPSSGIYKTADGIGVSVGGTLVAEFTPAGLRKGSRYIGELIPYSGSTAQALTVLPYGQTLDRTTYADLWTLAQIEIAAGNTFYNNGNGSTTFGIGDMRGRVPAGKDNMGGSAAGRLTSTTMTPDGNTIGAPGGAQTNTIAQTNLPAVNLTTSTLVRSRTNGTLGNTPGTTVVHDLFQLAGGGGTDGLSFPGLTSNLGSGTAFAIVQPTMVVNFLLFAGV